MDFHHFISDYKEKLGLFCYETKKTTLHIGRGGASSNQNAQYHLSPEVFFQIEGCNAVKCTDKNFHLMPKEMAIIPARTSHIEEFMTIENQFCMMVLIFRSEKSFSLHYMDIRPDSTTQTPMIAFHSENTPYLNSTINEIVRITLEDKNSGIEKDLMHVFLRLLNQSLNNPLPPKHSPSDGIAQKILNFVEQNLSIPELGVSFISKQFGYTPDHLNRLFKLETNENLSSHILNQRLELSYQILSRRNSSYNIAEVAWASGFNNIPYFNRQFKKKYKQTPSEMRK